MECNSLSYYSNADDAVELFQHIDDLHIGISQHLALIITLSCHFPHFLKQILKNSHVLNCVTLPHCI